MGRRIHHHIFLSLFLIVSGLIFSQSSGTPFITKTYTAQEGLPHSYIYCTLQDSKGYLWVGTRYGLSRFDGRNFTTIRLKDSTPDVIISWIHEDVHGRIWVYAGSEVYTLDGKNIDHYEKSKNFPITLVFNENENRPSALWRIKNGKMNRIDNYANVKPTPIPDQFSDFCMRSIITDQYDIYNIQKNIIVSDKHNQLDTIGKLIPPFDFIVIMGYFNKKLFFYTNKGVYSYSNKKVERLFNRELEGKNIFVAYRDKRNRIWVATEQSGVKISDPGNEQEFSYTLTPPHNLITNFYEDLEDNMWMSGFEGLTKIQYAKYETFPLEKYHFLDDLNTIVKDKEENLYCFSEKNGFTIYKNKKFIFNPENRLKNHLVDAVCSDDKNKLWGITRKNKIFTLQNNNVIFIDDIYLNKSSDFQPHIIFDNLRKKIWIPGDELYLGNENGFKVFADQNNIIIKRPLRLLLCKKNELLVATNQSELLFIDTQNTIKKIKTEAGFKPENIYRLFQDSTGKIWIVYPNMGLLCSKLSGDTLIILKKYKNESGLNNEIIEDMAIDKEERLWFSNMAGLSIIDQKKINSEGEPMILNLSKENGIPNKGLIYGRLVIDNKGNIWYSTQFGLLKFKSDIQFGDLPPKITIERVQLNNTLTDWNKYTDSLGGIFQIPYNPIINYKQNTISVNFKSASMNDADNVRYSYMLSGVNQYWSAGSRNNSVTFSKLKPGHYTFFVRARTNSMNWCTPAIFSFIIKKPFWQQIWFRILIILAIVGLMYMLYRLRINQLNKENRIRNQIASDLHDDLGSTLNSIRVYANLAAIEKENTDEYLKKIRENTQEAIAGIRDIIWVLDDKKDTIDHLMGRIRQFALPVCTAAHINFTIDQKEKTGNYRLDKDEKRNLYMILKESINNSIKYANCKNIKIVADMKIWKLEIIYTDDGLGFEKLKGETGNGLKNIKNRTKEINYSVSIESSKNQGITITLTSK